MCDGAFLENIKLQVSRFALQEEGNRASRCAGQQEESNHIERTIEFDRWPPSGRPVTSPPRASAICDQERRTNDAGNN